MSSTTSTSASATMAGARPRGPAAPLIVLLLLLVLVTVAACTPGADLPDADRPTASKEPVTITGLPSSRQVEVRDAEIAWWPVNEPGHATAAPTAPFSAGSKLYTLTPSGPLGATVDVRISLTEQAAVGVEAVVATRENEKDPWTYLPGAVSSDRRSVEFRTDHFSQFGVVLINPYQLFTYFKKWFLDGIDGGLTAEADKPRCRDEQRARGSDYNVASTPTDVTLWCFGFENDAAESRRVLKVTNNRPYYLMMRHDGLKEIRNDHRVGAAANLSRLLDPYTAIIEPRGTSTLAAELAPGTSAAARVSFDGLSQNLYALEVGTYTLVNILTRFGSAKVGKPLDIVDKILGVPKCYDALSDSAGAIVASCFSVDSIVKSFGPVGLLIAPLVALGDLAQYVKSSMSAVRDVWVGRDQYQIGIQRGAVRNTLTNPLGWRLSTNGLGPMRLGMTGPAGIRLGVAEKNTATEVCPASAFPYTQARSLSGDGDGIGSSWGQGPSGNLLFIYVRSPNFPTTSGIRVGDPWSRVTQVLGDKAQPAVDGGDGSPVLIVRDQNRYVEFLQADGKVYAMVAGTGRPANSGIDYC